MRKPLYIATTILFLSILAFPPSALADDQSDDDSGWEHIFGSVNNSPAGPRVITPLGKVYDPNHKHLRLENQYGDVDEVAVPQIVIRPGVRPDPATFVMPVVPEAVLPTSGTTSLGELEDNSPSGTHEEVQEFVATQLGMTLVSSNEKQVLLASNLNPSKSAPIQIRDLFLTRKTPADEFLDGAIIFGGGLGVLALALLGMTGFSALKLRREAQEL